LARALWGVLLHALTAEVQRLLRNDMSKTKLEGSLCQQIHPHPQQSAMIFCDD